MPDIVAIDADVLGRRRTGDETFVAGILGALGELDLPFRILAYVRDPKAVPPAATARGVVVPVRVDVSSNYIRSGLALPARLGTDRPALFQGSYLLPPALPCPGVLVVHDCSFLRQRGFMPAADRAAFRRFVPWSARRAARIVTGSEFTRRDLLELLPDLDPARVVAIPYGVSRCFAPIPGACRTVREQFGIDAPYVLFLGALQPRKNLARLLEAWAIMKARHPGPELLVLAGAPRYGVQPLAPLPADLAGQDSVRLTGYVEGDDTLRALLAGARALALPSLYEGFGFPAVEAMACGTPVLASTGTALPETTGGAALLVDPLSPAAMANALGQLLHDDVTRERWRRAGLRRAAELTWERTAERLAQVYVDVMREQPCQRRVVAPRLDKGPRVRVTASVVSTGEASRLRPCVQSLLEQGLGDNLRVVVVCNSPGDGSADLVRADFPEAVVIERHEQRGFAENHNTAQGISSSEFGLMVNPDVVLEPGCIGALLEHMEETPRCGAVMPLLLYPDGRPQPSARRFPRPFGTMLRRTPLRMVLPPLRFNAAHYLRPPVEARAIDWALGACVLVRRSAWREVGGFDEGFSRLYVEDIDLAWRMWQCGWEVWQTPTARARHEHQAATDTTLLDRRTLWHLQGIGRFLRNHPTVLAGLQPGMAGGVQTSSR